jgi:hypothetical protein
LASRRTLTFVTGVVESAVAQAAAVSGDGIVGVGAVGIDRQCLNASPLGVIVVQPGRGLRRGHPKRRLVGQRREGIQTIVLVWIAGDWLIGGVGLQT